MAQVTSSCVGDAIFTSAYQNNAADMALSRIYALGVADTQLIDIPTVYIDSAMSGLSAIYNTAAVLQADSVYNKYCIHAFPNGFIKTSFTVDLDTTYPWTHAWMAGTTTTGNTSIDNLMSHYGFSVTGHYSIGGVNLAYLHTTMPINTKRFMDSLSRFAGVYSWHDASTVGDAPKRAWFSRDSVSHYSFRIGWGDCLAGCTFSKTWYYTVNNNCDVLLDSAVLYNASGAGGFPTADNCRLGVNDPKIGSFNQLSFYPNPASTSLTIEVPKSEYTYTIKDITGRIAITGKCYGAHTIDIQQLNDGMYLIEVVTTDGVVQVGRFVKS